MLPAINPDIALFHAPLADRAGNVYIGRRRELLTMAHASKQTFVTVEAISEHDLFDDPMLRPGRGAGDLRQPHRPRQTGRLADRPARDYGCDDAAISRYVQSAKTEEGFRRFLDEWLGVTEATV